MCVNVSCRFVVIVPSGFLNVVVCAARFVIPSAILYISVQGLVAEAMLQNSFHDALLSVEVFSVYGCLSQGHLHTLLEYPFFQGFDLCCLPVSTFPLLSVLKVLIPTFISLGLILAFSSCLMASGVCVPLDLTIIL
jgi:hypothetical protein